MKLLRQIYSHYFDDWTLLFKKKSEKTMRHQNDRLHTGSYNKTNPKYEEFKKFASLFGIPLVTYFRTRNMKVVHPTVRISGVER